MRKLNSKVSNFYLSFIKNCSNSDLEPLLSSLSLEKYVHYSLVIYKLDIDIKISHFRNNLIFVVDSKCL